MYVYSSSPAYYIRFFTFVKLVDPLFFAVLIIYVESQQMLISNSSHTMTWNYTMMHYKTVSEQGEEYEQWTGTDDGTDKEHHSHGNLCTYLPAYCITHIYADIN